MATKKKGRKPTESSKQSADSKDSAGDGNKESGYKSGAEKAGKGAVSGKSKVPDTDRKDKGKDKRKESQGGLVSDMRQFFKDVVAEYRKITWPGRSQVIQETYSVLVLVTLITLMVLGMDWVFAKFVFGPFENWARYMGGGIGHG